MNEMTYQTQDSKFEPWRSEAEHATSRSRRFPTIFNLYLTTAFHQLDWHRLNHSFQQWSEKCITKSTEIIHKEEKQSTLISL